MLTGTFDISIRGRPTQVPAYFIEQAVVIVKGRFLRTAEIFDQYWLETAKCPEPRAVISQLQSAAHPPDIFRFTQRVPQTTPAFDYHTDWDNVAAVPVSTYDQWFQKQISSASRRNVRASEKKGVVVRACEFDETYIRGIMGVSNESPIRAGRKYWHFGKSFAQVQAEQGTYRERSTFLGAFLGDEMIGYLKIVWDERTAAIMQIVSKLAHLDKRPNNAMLAEAVRLCAARGVEYLQYERFVYGRKLDSSLTRFKRENGFVRFDVPVYFVPLTVRGRLALRLGLHKNLKDRLPYWLTKPLLDARSGWYARRTSTTVASSSTAAIEGDRVA